MAEVGTHDYGKGKTHNAVSVANSTTNSVDLVTQGFEKLVLVARMPAASAGNLAVAVQPYEDDGTTLFAQALPTDASVAAVLNGGVSRLTAVYRLNGMDKVSVQVTNSDSVPRAATVVYFLAD